MRWFLHTRKGVLSTKLTPVHFPNRTFFMNNSDTMLKFHKTVIRKQLSENDGACVRILFPYRISVTSSPVNTANLVVILCIKAFKIFYLLYPLQHLLYHLLH